jgi:hypothetical protein
MLPLSQAPYVDVLGLLDVWGDMGEDRDMHLKIQGVDLPCCGSTKSVLC